MTYRMSIFRRRPDLSEAEFQAYWRDVHAPIAVTIPALQRYEQNCAVQHHRSGDAALSASADGFCKLQFPSEEAMQGVMSPDLIRVLKDDEAQFLEGLRTFVIRPSEIVPLGDGAETKLVALVTRRRDLDAGSFEQRWRGAFADWVAAQDGIAGYTQNAVTARTVARQAASYDEAPVDCIDELWLTHAAGSDAARALIRSFEEQAATHAAALDIAVVVVNVPPIPGAEQAHG